MIEKLIEIVRVAGFRVNRPPMTCADAGRRGGSSKSAAKQAASRTNGKRGGRPRKIVPTAAQNESSGAVVVAPATERI